MKARLASFGRLELDGEQFDHDVVIERGTVRRRKKGRIQAISRTNSGTRPCPSMKRSRGLPGG